MSLTSGNGGSISITGGTRTTSGTSGAITISSGSAITFGSIGISLPQKGGDAIIGPGKGYNDNDGKVRIQDADHNDLIVIDRTSISILGKQFDLQRVADALENFIDSDACNCPMGTLVSRGCQCGGN